ncbi:MAG: aminotransferase class V-fold PLP-dependent enzyme, partial [Spirochaetaceae bacterium]|nr:aminotransferase class V-fold PLP-dependent enzyme [Spirochaetaceae bacterium]
MNTLGEYRYFDWAATAPPEGAPLAFPWGNPSSRHGEGRKAREALEDARGRCAAALGVGAGEIFFTSGGTESNALPLFSTLFRNRGDILFSAAEHPSVGENCRVLERLGKTVAPIAVGEDGRVTGETLEAALKKNPDARFAAIMAVNNETGAVTDLSLLTGRLRNRGEASGFTGAPVHVHCDMVQAVGKIPLDLRALDVDSAS